MPQVGKQKFPYTKKGKAAAKKAAKKSGKKMVEKPGLNAGYKDHGATLADKLMGR